MIMPPSRFTLLALAYFILAIVSVNPSYFTIGLIGPGTYNGPARLCPRSFEFKVSTDPVLPRLGVYGHSEPLSVMQILICALNPLTQQTVSGDGNWREDQNPKLSMLDDGSIGSGSGAAPN